MLKNTNKIKKKVKKMDKKLLYFYNIFIIICFLITGYMTYNYYKIKNNIHETIKEVQVIKEKIVTDTIFIDKPIVYKEQILKHDTIKIYANKGDSTEAILPIVQKQYTDSLYNAWISGYIDCNLDYIEIFNKNKIIEINNYKEKEIIKYRNKRWNLGPSISYGYNFENKTWEPVLGISVTYSIFQW